MLLMTSSGRYIHSKTVGHVKWCGSETFEIESKLYAYTHICNNFQPSYNCDEVNKCHLVLISHMTHKNLDLVLNKLQA
jgi:hypothetical protein